jgi:transposase
MPEAFEWHTLDEETLPPLERILPDDVYEALQKEIQRQKEAMPPASGLGMDHLNTIPATYKDALKKATILMDRTLRWRRLCFLYEMGEREARKRCHALAKRNAELERRHQEDQQNIQRLQRRLRSLLKISESSPRSEASGEEDTSEEPLRMAPRKRGAPLGHRGDTRHIPPHVDREETIAPPAVCPTCGHGDLTDLNTVDDRYVEDISPALRLVTHRKYRQAFCSHCQDIVHHPEALHGPPVQTGPRLAAHLTQLHVRLGVTHRKLAVYTTEVLGIPLTASGVLGILNRMADRLEPVYSGIAHALTVQRVLHGDETGWKMDGQRWQMWCFCNAFLAFFHPDKSRGSQVAIGILGPDFVGLLHCDFYGAYNDFPNLQRCWIHFARDIHDERLITPNDPFLKILHDKTQFILDSAQALLAGCVSSANTKKFQHLMHEALDEMIALDPPKSRARVLIERLRKHRHSLLNFLNIPGAEFHNNRVERQLRPIVIFRKLSFGNRTSFGALRYARLATVIETARLQKHNIQDFLFRIRLAQSHDFVSLAAELIPDTS